MDTTEDDPHGSAVRRAYKDLLDRKAARRPPIWERHPTLTGGVIAIVAALLSGVIGFTGATDEVHVHGSDEARKANQRLAATVPPSFGKSPVPTGGPGPDHAAFSAAFKVFLNIRCREVNPDSSEACTA